jgi:hypothetical protein
MSRVLFDFADPQAAQAWRAIDDRVMGGVSRSRLRHDAAGHAVFEGEVSLERNGGFASVRSAAGAWGMPGAQAVLLTVRGAPRQYKLSLLMDDGFDGVNYQAGFGPTAQWSALRLPVADFRASFRGREIPNAEPLEPGRIRQVGLLIANRQAGPFALELRSIALA